MYQAIYSSQGEIKKNNSVETQLVKKSDYVRVSLQKLETIQCKIKTEDSSGLQRIASAEESTNSVSI